MVIVLRQFSLLFLQQFHALSKGEVRRYGTIATVNLIGLNLDVLEQQNFAGKGKAHASDVPVVVVDLALLHQKMTAAVKVSQDAPAKADILVQRAINPCDAVTHR